MGQGIELARKDSPAHTAMLDDFKDQLLIALIVKAGGSLKIPVATVDATGDYVLMMSVNDGVFEFVARKKS